MDPFVGQLMLVPYNFAPKGWAFCQGQLLPISQNTALYSLLGTQFGGDGRVSFGLPNLQGKVALAAGQGAGQPMYPVGQAAGEAQVTLLSAQTPAHTHSQGGTTGATGNPGPQNSTFGQGGGKGHGIGFYTAAPTPATAALMAATALSPAGSSQPHNNLMPYLTLNYIIALVGVFPARP